MTINTKFLATALLGTLFLSGCGGETSTKESLTLNTNNYVEIAKNIYAQQNGKDKGIDLQKATPGQALNTNTLYLNKVVRPRNQQLSEVEVLQSDTLLNIKVDNANKYATITLSGAKSAQKTIDMKAFTVAE